MIAGYYLLLAAGLYWRNTVLITAGLITCLLSRYAILPLAPFVLWLLFLYESRKKALIISGSTVAGVLICFLVPYVLHQPEVLIKGFEYYTTCAISEWRGQSWQEEGALPFQLSNGYGFAIYFYGTGKGSLLEKLDALQWTHRVISLALPIAGTVWYMIRGKNRISLHRFLLLFLYFYLVVFYSFIQVPYAYLFFTVLMLSGFVFMAFMGFPAHLSEPGSTGKAVPGKLRS
jgi:hypothetical protein